MLYRNKRHKLIRLTNNVLKSKVKIHGKRRSFRGFAETVLTVKVIKLEVFPFVFPNMTICTCFEST